MNTIQNYINGKIQSSSTRTSDIYDPSKGEIISKVVLSNEEDFNNAINNAKNSQLAWSQTTPLKRSRIISKFKELIEACIISFRIFSSFI